MRETASIDDTVRSRIDTALNRGRCGLWDWDLASGRVFWSQSMFDILGLAAARQAAQLRRGQRAGASRRRAALRARDAARRCRRPRRSTACSACAMRTATGSGCARAASWCAIPASRDPHLIGIAVDITEQKRLAEERATADMRLRDAIETISEAFVLWDADNRLVLCNSKFQSLHGLTDEAVAPGTPYEDISAAGSKPIVRMQIVERGPRGPRRAHLRGAARGRALAADQRAAHQGRRLRLGRHRHHRAEAARGEADREREAAEGDRRGSALVAAGAGDARPSSLPISPSATPSRRTAPRRPTRPSPNSSPT